MKVTGSPVILLCYGALAEGEHLWNAKRVFQYFTFEMLSPDHSYKHATFFLLVLEMFYTDLQLSV